MPTYHATKEEVIDVCWEKLKQAGALEPLVALVWSQAQTAQGYSELVEAIIENAWKRGFNDCLYALELGALEGLPAPGLSPKPEIGGRN